MHDHRFVAVARPHPAEGIGRALLAAFSNRQELPVEWNGYVARLDRTGF